MTVQQLVEELWQQLGKPTNFCPRTDPDDPDTFDLAASAGGAQLLTWLNNGYRKVAAIRDSRGHIIRFRNFITHGYYKFPSVSGTVAAGSALTITLDASAGAAASSQDDRYVGWLVSLRSSDEYGYIVDYEGTTRVATVHKAWTTNPDSGDAYQLLKSSFEVVESGHAFASDHLVVADARAILGIRDLKVDRSLEPAQRTTDLPLFVDETGTDPSVYALRGKKILLDLAISDANKYFDVEVLLWPAALTAADEEPEVPEVWQQVILLYALWWGLRARFEWDGAYATAKDAERMVDELVPDDNMENEFVNGRLVPRRGY